MVVARQGLTLDEFLALPERKPALEYADGRITQKGSPKARHSVLQTHLAAWFNRHGVPEQQAAAFVKLRTTFGGRSYVPDLVVLHWDHIPVDASGEVVDETYLAPDIAIEILSPGQGRPALIRRCAWYVANGVPLALLVDPRRRGVMVFRAGAAAETLGEADEIDFGPDFPFPPLSVRQLFALLQPRSW